ncbi:MAG: diguanylate cyclase [Dehalococcoidia bacterium]
MVVDATEAVRDPARLDALHRTGLLDSPAEEAFDRLTRLASKIIGVSVALVSLVDSDRQFFKSASGLSEPWVSQRQTPLSHSFCQHVVASGKPLVIDDARQDPILRHNPAIPDLGVVAYAGVPLTTTDGKSLGSFCVIDPEPRAWTDDDLSVLSDLAAAAMTEIELRARQQELTRANEQLAWLASCDELTGLSNRRAFQERLDQELSRAQRHQRVFSLVMLDVDHFKTVNDTYGHPAGDAVLRSLATVLSAGLRRSDLAARYGGEEFVLLLPETAGAQGQELAERLRRAVEAMRVDQEGKQIQITCSFGVGAYLECGDSSAAVLRSADEALYRAKEAGRNRAILCRPAHLDL